MSIMAVAQSLAAYYDSSPYFTLLIKVKEGKNHVANSFTLPSFVFGTSNMPRTCVDVFFRTDRMHSSLVLLMTHAVVCAMMRCLSVRRKTMFIKTCEWIKLVFSTEATVSLSYTVLRDCP